MSISEVTDSGAVQAAMDEFNAIGRDAFLSKHGYGRARRYFLRGGDGKLYDSKAIVGVAYGYQFPDRGPLRNTDFSGGEDTVKRELERLGFEVIETNEPSGAQASPSVWIEKTIVRGRPDRQEGPHRVGEALWSPQQSADGRDIYANLREVKSNDVILHLTDNEAFVGASVAKEFVDNTFRGVTGTAWGDRPCFRVQLTDFRRIDPPLQRSWLFNDPQFSEELRSIARGPRGRGLFYNENMELNQGAYLTQAPRSLVDVLNRAYRQNTGSDLPTPLNATLAPSRLAGRPVAEPPRRIWLYAPGRNAGHWAAFHGEGIAAIGWDDLDDLSSYPDPGAIKAQMDLLSPEPESMVNANQCFDFSHRMNPGDWIFVKKGRREIIGFGVVSSPYRFEPHRPFYRHVHEVAWEKSGSWPTLSHRLLPMKTLTEISDDEVLVEELEQLLELVDPDPPPPSVVQPSYTAEDFARETTIPVETIGLWRSRLERKQHLIFQGPPGTGKTFVAERLARLLTANTRGLVEVVQFHPSYGYEDFMHGIRPVVQDGQMTFERLPGRFLQFCKAAKAVQDGSPCVLIIDEINRGNLSRIFGELMYLLEYRDKMIPLAGEESLFGIPSNVHLIGTMNTADRSIALVDHALRRRFSFVHLAPDYNVLRSHLEKAGLPVNGLVETLQAMNAAIDDRNYEIGISFFLKDGAALSSTLKDVWEGEIEPYLEEYFYDQHGKVEAFRWKRLSSGALAAWNVAV